MALRLWLFQTTYVINMSSFLRLKNLVNSCLVFGLVWAHLFSYGVAAEIVSGDFKLVDHRGNLVNKSSYNNKLRLVFFGFTRCPIICPTTLSEVSKVMSMLDKRMNQVQPIFISIDPEYDTIETVADYVSVFHPSVVGLTGSAEQVKWAAQNFNVTYGKGPVNSLDEAEEIFHSSYLYLMDRNGDLLDVIGYGTKSKLILEKLEQYL